MNSRKIVFGMVFLVIVVICFMFYVSFKNTYTIEKNIKTSSAQLPPISGLPSPPSAPKPGATPCPVGTDSCSLCHKSPKIDTELKPSTRGADFSVFVNKRDGYSLEVPKKFLVTGNDLQPYPQGGFLSAEISYSGRLGGLGIGVICGVIESAMKTSFQERGWRASAVRAENISVGERGGVAVFIKTIGDDLAGEGSRVTKSVFVEKPGGITLVFDGPSIEDEEYMKLFDDMIASVRFLDMYTGTDDQ